MLKYNVAVTIRSFSSLDIFDTPQFKALNLMYVNKLGRRMTGSEIIQSCQDAEVILAGTEPFNANILKKLPSLKMISRVGVGTDSIDVDFCRKQEIVICTTPESTTHAVAEHTLALIFALSKNIFRYCASKHDFSVPVTHGHMIRGKKIGIIGLGRIGREVAKISECLGADIQYYDPYVDSSPEERWECAPSLPSLLSTSDIISLHIPALPGDAPLLSKKEFSLIKDGAILINTARASLVDETALYQSLKTGHIRGAGLDVTSSEPYTGPLRNFQHVIITPHIASNTYESRKSMEMEALENITAAMESFS